MCPRYSSADDVPDGLLEVLGRSYSPEILAATIDEPRCAAELIDRIDVPRTTVYRRIRALAEHDLVELSRTPDLDGRHNVLVAANLDQLTISLAESGGFELDLTLANEPRGSISVGKAL